MVLLWFATAFLAGVTSVSYTHLMCIRDRLPAETHGLLAENSTRLESRVASLKIRDEKYDCDICARIGLRATCHPWLQHVKEKPPERTPQQVAEVPKGPVDHLVVQVGRSNIINRIGHAYMTRQECKRRSKEDMGYATSEPHLTLTSSPS